MVTSGHTSRLCKAVLRIHRHTIHYRLHYDALTDNPVIITVSPRQWRIYVTVSEGGCFGAWENTTGEWLFLERGKTEGDCFGAWKNTIEHLSLFGYITKLTTPHNYIFTQQFKTYCAASPSFFIFLLRKQTRVANTRIF